MNSPIEKFLDKKLSIPLWIFLFFPVSVYLAWEIFWYKMVGLNMVHWHTHLAVWVVVWVLGFCCLALFARRPFSERAKNGFVLFSAVVFALFTLEAVLQVTGTTKTYLEKASGSYSSVYQAQDKTIYHVWANPGQPHCIKKPEYCFWRPTNSLGLPDVEWPVAKQPHERRIMALGDSFTEGDGAPYDSSYVSLLKKKLQAAGDSFYVMNAGVCGSDPFDNYMVLKDKLLPYHPDIVLQGFSRFDLLTDIMTRGGMERYQKDGTLKYKGGPWWEPIYAGSYISRLFFRLAGYNELLMKKKVTAEQEKMVNDAAIDLFQKYAALCKQQGIKFCLVLRPEAEDIENGKYAYNFQPILQSLDSSVIMFDLLPYYRKYVAESKVPAREYFWKYDGHHNGRGYELMARGTYEQLLPLLQ